MNILNIQPYTNIKTQPFSPKSNKINNIPQHDTVHFKGLNPILKKSINTNVKRVPELKGMFTELFNAIDTNPTFEKTQHYTTLSKMIKENGFFQTLTTLCNPNPKGEIRTLVKLADENPVILATKNNKPVLTLNYGTTYKFSDNYDNRIDAKKQMIISFNNENQTEQINFCLDKNYNFILDQGDKTFSRRTIFRFNGNRERVIEQGAGCNQQRTFYNEDGTESFWKNLFFGGPAIPS